MMEFDEIEIARIEELLSGPDGTAVIDLMSRASLGEDLADAPPHLRQQTIDMGWIDADSGRLKDRGSLVADPCREYTYWRGRNQALPFEGHSGLGQALFKGKSLVEIGCGMGVNLMSLSKDGQDPCGVEPVPGYVQVGTILRRIEGMAPVDIRTGSGENIPFEDGRFDMALCVSAHQYFDIVPALAEIARVLKPGGGLLLLGGTLDRYLRDALAEFPSNFKAHVITSANTLSYMAARRRIFKPRGQATTSRPIYPLRGAMHRWLRQTGFDVDPRRDPEINTETVFRAVKRG